MKALALAVAVLLCSCVPAWGEKPPSRKQLECEMPGSVTEVCWDKAQHRPDVMRFAELVAIVDAFFPAVEAVKVEIYVLPYEQFERRATGIFYREAREGIKEGPAVLWAHTYKGPDGQIIIETWGEAPDQYLIHELLHHYMIALASYSVMHDHKIINALTINIQGSQFYKTWLRKYH